jgi:hypothetical protein
MSTPLPSIGKMSGNGQKTEEEGEISNEFSKNDFDAATILG